jgi:hypothetical protein
MCRRGGQLSPAGLVLAVGLAGLTDHGAMPAATFDQASLIEFTVCPSHGAAGDAKIGG